MEKIMERAQKAFFFFMIWKKNVNRFSHQSTNGFTQVQRANISQTQHWRIITDYSSVLFGRQKSLLCKSSACPPRRRRERREGGREGRKYTIWGLVHYFILPLGSANKLFNMLTSLRDFQRFFCKTLVNSVRGYNKWREGYAIKCLGNNVQPPSS